MSLQLLGQGLSRLDDLALHEAGTHLLKQQPHKIADTLIEHARRTFRLSWLHARAELKNPRRSFALPDLWDDDQWVDSEWDDMADHYGDYLTDLAGVSNQQLVQRVHDTLEDSMKAGHTFKETQGALANVLSGWRDGRLRTIIRTEGTRVASTARQSLAEKSAESGLGPDYLIYDAILDDRTTRTCTYGDGRKKLVSGNFSRELDDLNFPAHYNCRSIMRYGFKWIEEDEMTPFWTPESFRRWKEIQQEEFPGWVQSPLPGRGFAGFAR